MLLDRDHPASWAGLSSLASWCFLVSKVASPKQPISGYVKASLAYSSASSEALSLAGQAQCHCQPWSMQGAAPFSTSAVLTNASSSLLWLKIQLRGQETQQGKAVGMTEEKIPSGACWGIFHHLVGPLQRVTFPSAGSPYHPAPWCHRDACLWELKPTSCPFLATRLHARTQESAGPHSDTAQGPQILGLTEAGAGGQEKTKHDPDRNAFGSICCQSGPCCAHKATQHMAVLAA